MYASKYEIIKNRPCDWYPQIYLAMTNIWLKNAFRLKVNWMMCDVISYFFCQQKLRILTKMENEIYNTFFLECINYKAWNGLHSTENMAKSKTTTYFIFQYQTIFSEHHPKVMFSTIEISVRSYLCNKIPLCYWLWHKILPSINQSQPC